MDGAGKIARATFLRTSKADSKYSITPAWSDPTATQTCDH